MNPIPTTAMTERSERLTKAFKQSATYRSGLTSSRTAAERHGFNPNTFKSNLSGVMDFSYAAAIRYGDAFKVRPEWLYTGSGDMRANPHPKRVPQEIPVIAWVSAGRLADVGQIDQLGDGERILVGGLPPGDYFATDVLGDSMDRVSPEGSRIVVRAGEKEPRSGGFYVFSNRGEATYKRFRSDPDRLEPYSTNPANEPIFLGKGKGWSVVGRVVRSILDLE